MTLKTRRPTGAVPWPLILIEGGEKSGKSWALAVLSSSPRVGDTYWIDLAEGSGDEYGAIPGARYEIVEHDGTFGSILDAVTEIHSLAGRALADGKPPVVLGIDSMTAEWDLLKDWATNRARSSEKNRKLLERNPNAEIVVSTNYWNDANTRHRKLMRLLMTFPGIVVMTARGKFVAKMDSSGRPVEGEKVYAVEGQKNLAFDASCWVRLSRDDKPMVIGARSVHSGIRPGVDEPRHLPDDWTLDKLVFDLLRCDPAQAHVRDLTELRPDATPEQIRDEALEEATPFERVRGLYDEARSFLTAEVDNEDGGTEQLGDLLIRIGRAKQAAAAPADQNLHKRMHVLWRDAGFADDRDGRLAFTAEILGRDVTTSSGLTTGDAQKVIARLQAYIRQNTPAEATQ